MCCSQVSEGVSGAGGDVFWGPPPGFPDDLWSSPRDGRRGGSAVRFAWVPEASALAFSTSASSLAAISIRRRCGSWKCAPPIARRSASRVAAACASASSSFVGRFRRRRASGGGAFSVAGPGVSRGASSFASGGRAGGSTAGVGATSARGRCRRLGANGAMETGAARDSISRSLRRVESAGPSGSLGRRPGLVKPLYSDVHRSTSSFPPMWPPSRARDLESIWRLGRAFFSTRKDRHASHAEEKRGLAFQFWSTHYTILIANKAHVVFRVGPWL